MLIKVNSLKWNLRKLNKPCMTIAVFQRACLSSSMKFLVETDLSEIPAFYFTEHSYTLYLFMDVSYIVNCEGNDIQSWCPQHLDIWD